MAEPTALVATLIADPSAPPLTPALLAKAEAVFGGSARSRVLAEGVAIDLAIYAGEAVAVEARLRDALAGAPVDVVVQAEAGRRKRLFLADMDSTMIEQECIDELADFAGLKGPVAAITERAMRGEIPFEPALRERVALLKGLPTGIAARVLAERITFTPGGRALVATLRAAGAYCCLVSGGFTLFTGPVAAALGFDEDRANVLLAAGGVLTGAVAEPILGRDAKRATLIELRDRFGLSSQDVLAAGDGANDLAMLTEAGTGVAFRAKPAVAAAAGVRIDHGDLTALLYLQGYAESDIVRD